MEQALFLPCGYGSFVSLAHLTAIVVPDSAPIRRIIQEARELGTLIDATCGRKTKAVLVMDTDQIILSAFSPEQLLGKLDASEVGFAEEPV